MKKSMIAPVVAASLLINTVASTVSYASPLFVGVQQVEVMVSYKNDAGKQKVLEKAKQVKGDLTSLNMLQVVLSETAITTLSNDPDIGNIERMDEKVELLGDLATAQWDVEAVNAPQAWSDGLTGQGVKVAVIDSGVATSAELPNVVQRVSFLQDNPSTTVDESSPLDHDGHGTNVAGIIGAKQGGGTYGGKDIVGVAPNVSLYSLKVIDGSEGTVGDVVEAIDWAIANNMDIINLSLGLQTDNSLLKEAVDRAYRAGIIIVAAAGNDGNGQPVLSPAKYDSVIAVSATDQSKTIASYSSTGTEVEFSAPGTSVLNTHAKIDGTGTYAFHTGTSQASPHVAGFLALLLQKDPSQSASQVRMELQSYVDDLGEEGRDELYGYGFINYLAYDDVAPAKVINLMVTNVTSTTATIDYVLPTDEDFDKIQIIVNGQIYAETTEATYELHELSPALNYTVEIKAVDKKGNSSEGVTLQFQTAEKDVTPPAEVLGLETTEITHNSIKLSFNTPADADFIKSLIYVDGEFVGETFSTEYELTDLLPETEYEITVTTIDNSLNESVGQTIRAATIELPDTTAPSEVTDLKVTKTTANSITVSFHNPSDADYAKTNLYVNGELIADTASETFTIEGLDAEIEYEIVAKTVDMKGNESDGVLITTLTDNEPDVTAPAEVTDLKAMNVKSDSMTITFTNPANPDFAKSIVYVNGQSIGETTSGNYALKNLQAKTEYSITVKAMDRSGNQTEGSTIIVKTSEITELKDTWSKKLILLKMLIKLRKTKTLPNQMFR